MLNLVGRSFGFSERDLRMLNLVGRSFGFSERDLRARIHIGITRRGRLGWHGRCAPCIFLGFFRQTCIRTDPDHRAW